MTVRRARMKDPIGTKADRFEGILQREEKAAASVPKEVRFQTKAP